MDSKIASGIAVGFLAGIAVALLVKEKPEKHKLAPKPDKELVDEQFTRNIQFFGEEGQSQINNARVIVVGLGGVGSHAAVSLARSGIGHLRLIDFDRVTMSSLNRHASGTWKDVGVAKVVSVKEFISSFNPSCHVDDVEEMFSIDEADRLIAEFKPDFVVDAIDNVPTKVDLLAYCMEKGIRVISSCGTACKSDPSKIRIGFLENVEEDELARAVRQRLTRKKCSLKIPVVFSTEKSQLKLLPLKDFQEKDPKNFQAVKNFRVRILPVIGPLPAIAGNALSAFVLCELGGLALTETQSRDSLTIKQKRKMTDWLREKMKMTAKEFDKMCSGDVLERVISICERKSVKSQVKNGLIFVTKKRDEGLVVDNLVLMTRAEAENHWVN